MEIGWLYDEISQLATLILIRAKLQRKHLHRNLHNSNKKNGYIYFIALSAKPTTTEIILTE